MKKVHPTKAGKLRVSQSLMKGMREYLDKRMCGIVLESKFIKKDFPEILEDPNSKSCKAIPLGTFFEWMVTKALPKSGQVPQPKYMSSKGVTGKVEDFYEPYRTAVKNAERVTRYLKDMGIEILEAGTHKTKGDHEGTIDIRCRWMKGHPAVRKEKQGHEFIIDMKYSGLLDDRWNKMGWGRMQETGMNEQKRYHGTQATEYNYIWDLPVYFLVKDTGDNDKVLFLETFIEEFVREQHLVEAKKTLADMKFFEEIGFTPYPEINRCSDCPLKDRCEHKILYPQAVPVFITDND